MHNIHFTQNASTKGKILCILYYAVLLSQRAFKQYMYTYYIYADESFILPHIRTPPTDTHRGPPSPPHGGITYALCGSIAVHLGPWPDPSFAAWQRIQHVNGFSVWCQWATTSLHNASDICFGNDKFPAAIANAGRARNTFCIYFISRHLHQGKKVNFTTLLWKHYVSFSIYMGL